MGAIVFPWTSAAGLGVHRARGSTCGPLRRRLRALLSDERPPQRVLHEVPVGHRIWCATPSATTSCASSPRGTKCPEGEGRAPRLLRHGRPHGRRPQDARAAFKAAWDAQRAHDEALTAQGARCASDRRAPTRRDVPAAAAGDDSVARPLGILVVAHPTFPDPYLSGAVVDALEEMGATIARGRRRHGSRARLQEELRVLWHHAVAHQPPELHRLYPPGAIGMISAFSTASCSSAPPCGPDS